MKTLLVLASDLMTHHIKGYRIPKDITTHPVAEANISAAFIKQKGRYFSLGRLTDTAVPRAGNTDERSD